MRRTSTPGLTLLLPLLGALLVAGLPAPASSQDLTLTYETRMEFGGLMGQALRLVPGMGEATGPRRTVTRISGDRLRSDDGDDTSIIVNAATRQFIQLDHAERTYMIMTPEGMQDMAEQARERAAANPAPRQEARPDQPTPPENEGELRVEARVNSERTGRTAPVAGLDAEEWYMTIEADFEVTDEDGANPMMVGSTVAFSDIWLSQSVPGGEEQQRIWSAFGEEMARSIQADGGGMEQVFAVNPQLQVMVEQNEAAMAEMQGTPVRTTVLMVLVPPGIPFDQERAAADLEGDLGPSAGDVAGDVAGQAARGAAASAARGAMGRLGGLMGRRGGGEPAQAEEQAPPSQSTLMRMVEELQSISRESIPASAFEIPEGYREIKLSDLMGGGD